MSLYFTIQVHPDLRFFLTANNDDTFESVVHKATQIYADITKVPKDPECMGVCSAEGTFFPDKSKISEFERILKEGTTLMLRSKPTSTNPQVGPSQLERYDKEEQQLRIRLAAAYRIFEHYGWSEIIYNHLTVRIPGMRRNGEVIMLRYNTLSDKSIWLAL